MKMKTPYALFAVLVAAALIAVGCGGDDEPTAPEPLAQVDSLTGNMTQVILDKDFLGALTSLKVTPAPVGDATISKAAVASFPITGGSVKYFDPTNPYRPFVQGSISHDGSGLSLTAGGKTVELTDFVVDPGTSVLSGKVSVDGEVAAESAELFILDGSTLEPIKVDESAGTAVLRGTTVKLKGSAADLLNMTFGIEDLKEGLVIGIAKITLNTKSA